MRLVMTKPAPPRRTFFSSLINCWMQDASSYLASPTAAPGHSVPTRAPGAASMIASAFMRRIVSSTFSESASKTGRAPTGLSPVTTRQFPTPSEVRPLSRVSISERFIPLALT